MEICVQEMFHDHQTARLLHLFRHSDLSSRIFHLDLRAEFSVRRRIGFHDPHGTSRLRIHQKPVGICFYKISAIFIKDREISQCIKPLHRIWPCHYLDPFSKYRTSFDHDLPGGQKPRFLLLPQITDPDSRILRLHRRAVLHIIHNSGQGQLRVNIRLAVPDPAV